MKRGKIYYTNLNPLVGAEIAKRCHVLIVSNDLNNRVATTITILPITSNVNQIYPFEVFLESDQSGLPKPSKVQTQQIRTISKLRIQGDVVGCLNAALMLLVENALQLHLFLN